MTGVELVEAFSNGFNGFLFASYGMPGELKICCTCSWISCDLFSLVLILTFLALFGSENGFFTTFESRLSLPFPLMCFMEVLISSWMFWLFFFVCFFSLATCFLDGMQISYFPSSRGSSQGDFGKSSFVF